MTILEVNGLKKIYSTRFGGNKVEALKNVNFSVEQGRVCCYYGRIWFRQNNTFKYPCCFR